MQVVYHFPCPVVRPTEVTPCPISHSHTETCRINWFVTRGKISEMFCLLLLMPEVMVVVEPPWGGEECLWGTQKPKAVSGCPLAPLGLKCLCRHSWLVRLCNPQKRA